jgi:hypothetical protein
MGEFGKRTANAAQGLPLRGHVLDAPRQSAPVWSEHISEQDLKTLEKGQLPAWANVSRFKLLCVALLIVATALGAAAFYGPELARDLRYAGTFKVANDLQAIDGRCKRYIFLISLCNAKIRSIGNEQSATTTEFLMLFRGGDGEEMIPVRSSVDASAVGIQYAVSDVLLNRTLSLLGVILLLSWTAWTFFDKLRRGQYKDGPAYEALMQYVALHSTPE